MPRECEASMSLVKEESAQEVTGGARTEVKEGEFGKDCTRSENTSNCKEVLDISTSDHFFSLRQ